MDVLVIPTAVLAGIRLIASVCEGDDGKFRVAASVVAERIAEVALSALGIFRTLHTFLGRNVRRESDFDFPRIAGTDRVAQVPLWHAVDDRLEAERTTLIISMVVQISEERVGYVSIAIVVDPESPVFVVLRETLLGEVFADVVRVELLAP